MNKKEILWTGVYIGTASVLLISSGIAWSVGLSLVAVKNKIFNSKTPRLKLISNKRKREK